MREQVLLHICCGHCCIAPFDRLKGEGFEVTGYFYNPNIHPLIEFRRRLKALKVLQARLIDLNIIYEEEYGLFLFLDTISGYGQGRCRDCYQLRLGATARKAKELGIGNFTTTLLISPHQDHKLIREVGEMAAARRGVSFLYMDFRELYEESRLSGKRYGLYNQQYCGCIFSEYERYKDTGVHIYKGGGK